MLNTTRIQGFTIIEILIVVVIIGILSAIALPAYNDYVVKSRRSDALSALSDIRQQQEKFRNTCPSYAASMSASCSVGGTTISFSPNSTSPDGYYVMSVASHATGYLITASATGVQLNDTECPTIEMNGAGSVVPSNCRN